MEMSGQLHAASALTRKKKNVSTLKIGRSMDPNTEVGCK